MGYAGYAPGKYAPPPPTAVQAALYAVHSQAALELIAKLTKNVVVSPTGSSAPSVQPGSPGAHSSKNDVVSPTEEKFKRVKLSNPKIKAALVDVPGAVDALLAIGWIREQEPEGALVVPKGRHFTMADVRIIDDATERLRKRQKDEARATSAQQRSAANGAAAQLRAQIDADRRERAARAADVCA